MVAGCAGRDSRPGNPCRLTAPPCPFRNQHYFHSHHHLGLVVPAGADWPVGACSADTFLCLILRRDQQAQ
jgi:hypothetical protein